MNVCYLSSISLIHLYVWLSISKSIMFLSCFLSSFFPSFFLKNPQYTRYVGTIRSSGATSFSSLCFALALHPFPVVYRDALGKLEAVPQSNSTSLKYSENPQCTLWESAQAGGCCIFARSSTLMHSSFTQCHDRSRFHHRPAVQ